MIEQSESLILMFSGLPELSISQSVILVHSGITEEVIADEIDRKECMLYMIGQALGHSNQEHHYPYNKEDYFVFRVIILSIWRATTEFSGDDDPNESFGW